MHGEVYTWVPFTVAIATVIANAAVTYAAVSRHERTIEFHGKDIQDLKLDVAVLKSHVGGGGRNDGEDR